MPDTIANIKWKNTGNQCMPANGIVMRGLYMGRAVHKIHGSGYAIMLLMDHGWECLCQGETEHECDRFADFMLACRE